VPGGGKVAAHANLLPLALKGGNYGRSMYNNFRLYRGFSLGFEDFQKKALI